MVKHNTAPCHSKETDIIFGSRKTNFLVHTRDSSYLIRVGRQGLVVTRIGEKGADWCTYMMVGGDLGRYNMSTYISGRDWEVAYQQVQPTTLWPNDISGFKVRRLHAATPDRLLIFKPSLAGQTHLIHLAASIAELNETISMRCPGVSESESSIDNGLGVQTILSLR